GRVSSLPAPAGGGWRTDPKPRSCNTHNGLCQKVEIAAELLTAPVANYGLRLRDLRGIAVGVRRRNDLVVVRVIEGDGEPPGQVRCEVGSKREVGVTPFAVRAVVGRREQKQMR